MDSKFVDIITDTYLTQFDLYESKLPNKKEAQKSLIVNDIMSLLRELRESDIEIYDKVYDTDRITQKNVIYDYITESWKDTLSKHKGKIAAAAGGVVGGAIGLDYYEDGDFLGNDDDPGVLDKLSGFLSNVDYKKFISDPRNYFSMSLVGVLGYMFAKSEFVNKQYEKILFKISKSIYKLSKSLKKSRQLTFRFVILKQNFEQCYKQCGTSIEDIKKGHFNWFKPNKRQTSKKTEVEQAECLKNCYLMFHAQTIGLFCSNYLLCINTNKQIEQNLDYSADDFILGFQNKPKGNTTCKKLFDVFEEAIDEYKQLAKFLSKVEKRHQTYNDCMDLLKKQINKQLQMTNVK